MNPSEESPILTLGLPEPALKVSTPPKYIDYIDQWGLEPELSGPIPRRVVLRWWYVPMVAILAALLLATAVLLEVAYLGFGVWFDATKTSHFVGSVSLFLFTTVFVIVRTERNLRLSRLLASRGTATRGIIVESKEFYVSRAGNIYRRGVIEYHTQDRRDTKATLCAVGENGDTLTVLYLPEAPERAMLYKDCYYKAVASYSYRLGMAAAKGK